MYQGIPIIGIVGGIGSGKSFVARLFGELGCVVIDSDLQVTQVYQQQGVREELKKWWGDEALLADGSINRRVIASRIFNSPADRERLQRLIHPLVARLRDELMAKTASATDSTRPPAFVWDTPLLIEAGLANECDAIVYVDSPLAVRLERVKARGWDAAELTRRENSQSPLDKKRSISHYVVTNTASRALTSNARPVPACESEPRLAESPVSLENDTLARQAGSFEADIRLQVRSVLSRILTVAHGTDASAGLKLMQAGDSY